MAELTGAIGQKGAQMPPAMRAQDIDRAIQSPGSLFIPEHWTPQMFRVAADAINPGLSPWVQLTATEARDVAARMEALERKAAALEKLERIVGEYGNVEDLVSPAVELKWFDAHVIITLHDSANDNGETSDRCYEPSLLLAIEAIKP